MRSASVAAPCLLDIGVYLPQIALSYDTIREIALTCERLGFGSLWLLDHLYPPGAGTYPSLEAWTLATALLADTRTLRVGHLTLNAQLRHPALLAKMAATLDHISGGRLDLGLGSGSYAEEHRRAGIRFGGLADRSSRLDEYLAALHSIFSSSPASFTGSYFTIRELPCLPLPVQETHPPIHVGGIGRETTLPTAARWADTLNVPAYGVDKLPQIMRAADAACEAIGRDPASLRRSIQAVLVCVAEDASLPAALDTARRRYGGSGWNLESAGYFGTPDRIAERMLEHRELGIDQFVLLPFDRGKGEVLSLLAEEVLPRCA